MKRSVQDWFEIIQRDRRDDLLARQLLDDLIAYRIGTQHEWLQHDLDQLLALFTAIRLDQMTKENS